MSGIGAARMRVGGACSGIVHACVKWPDKMTGQFYLRSTLLPARKPTVIAILPRSFDTAHSCKTPLCEIERLKQDHKLIRAGAPA
jgi:hypothetical protein